MKLLLNLQRADHRLFGLISQYAQHTPCVSTARVFSRSGDGILHVLIAAMLSVLHPLPGVILPALASTMLLERALYWPLKNGLKRLRPPEKLVGFASIIQASDKFSFPSGHSSAVFALATLLSLCIGGPIAVLLLWACGVALSRVILGVHFPGDILAGAALGSICALVNASYWGFW